MSRTDEMVVNETYTESRSRTICFAAPEQKVCACKNSSGKFRSFCGCLIVSGLC